MGRVLTNNCAFLYSIEDTENDENNAGELQSSPVWYELEVNSPGTFGAETTTVARSPISPNRQRRKGTLTDLDSSADFEVDTTISHLKDFIEGFAFATATGVERFAPSAISSDAFTVTAGSALDEGTLVYARAFPTTSNNGLHVVDTGSSTTSIPVTSTLSDESAATNSEVVVAGFRTAAGDLSVSVSGGVTTIASAAGIFNSPGLNIIPGAAIFIGGDAALNRFSDAANIGYARVKTVAGDGSQITIDKTNATFVTEAGVAQEVDILLGEFIRNVPVNDAAFLKRSFQFEVTYQNLANSPAGDEYEYSIGNYCNTVSINAPLTDKSTMSLAFVGLDTETPTTTRKANAATPIRPNKTGAINTTQDLPRLRITELDETGLTTDFKSLTLTLNNNVSPEKVLANPGPKYMNYGNFEVTVEAELLFTDSRISAAVRNNTTLTMDFAMRNDDGAVYFDIPAITLGGGSKSFPVGESVTISTTSEAFEDPTLGTSLGVTIFPYTPKI
jgi:hypothetical protein